MAALDARTDCRNTNMVNADSGTARLTEVDVISKLAEETDADADPALPRRMSAILTLEKPSQGHHKAVVVRHAARNAPYATIIHYFIFQTHNRSLNANTCERPVSL